MIPSLINENSITFFLPKYGQKTFRSDFPTFEELKKAVISGDEKRVEELAFPRKNIAKISKGNVIISNDDEVFYKNQLVPEYLALRILEHIKNQVTVSPLFAFAEKLMANPNLGVRNDLYKWLEKGSMPIYEDGDFMAYKLVKEDYTPIHTGGKYGQSQKVGEIVTQPRETCDENRDVTCSSGLHFCSYDYLPNFGLGYGNRKVIVLKINPTDVVAIPSDYNDTKGRTCRFEVVDEIDPAVIHETFGSRLVLNSLGTYKGETVKEEQPATSSTVNNKNELAVKAMQEFGNNKTKAAASLGISRSTLTKWLAIDSTVNDVSIDESTENNPDNYVSVDIFYDEDSWLDEDSWDENDEEIHDRELYLTDVSSSSKNRQKAENALDVHKTKTAAAESLGISRSTLNRWLNS